MAANPDPIPFTVGDTRSDNATVRKILTVGVGLSPCKGTT